GLGDVRSLQDLGRADPCGKRVLPTASDFHTPGVALDRPAAELTRSRANDARDQDRLAATSSVPSTMNNRLSADFCRNGAMSVYSFEYSKAFARSRLANSMI